MKLLFDQNVSPKLVQRLADLFPGYAHVQDLGLDSTDDGVVWEWAGREGFTVVSKDENYNHLSVLRGSPPKVLWLLLGNSTTQQVEDTIRGRIEDIRAFETDPTADVLTIG